MYSQEMSETMRKDREEEEEDVKSICEIVTIFRAVRASDFIFVRCAR